MDIPIDVKAVIDAACDIESARSIPLSVSVFIDDTAPADLVAHVRSVFASASANARVTIGYVDGKELQVPTPCDMAVLVAGVNEHIGEYAAKLRSLSVPAMVATTMPQLIADMAQVNGVSIPEGDIVSPVRVRSGIVEAVLQKKNQLVGAGGQEPIALDEAHTALLDERMGEWIVEVCSEKRLAFALAFPFVRRPLSVEAVRATSAQNAGVGLVVFLPGADMPIMTLNQAKMLLQIAAAYGQPLDKRRIKELAAVVGGAFACRGAARQLVGVVPGLGWAVKAAIGYSGTYAMGHAAIEYFEGGGNVSGVANVVSQARKAAVSAAGVAKNAVKVKS